MSAQKRRRKISSATHEIIVYVRYQNWSSLRVIQARTKMSLSTISDICNHAYKQAKIHETKFFHDENIASESHSERFSLLCQKQIDIMIKLVTFSYEWRCRVWIIVACKCEVIVSRFIIEKIFKEVEYEWYSSHQKLYLIVIMKTKHLD